MTGTGFDAPPPPTRSGVQRGGHVTVRTSSHFYFIKYCVLYQFTNFKLSLLPPNQQICNSVKRFFCLVGENSRRIFPL